MIKEYKPHLDKWGCPQEYKGVKFHPIKIVDEDMYSLFSELMCHNKNIIQDAEILKMSYLKFLVYVLKHQWCEDVCEKLIHLLQHITHEVVGIKYKQISETIQSHKDIKVYLSIGDTLFNETEFNDIREIILIQNGLSIEYVNDFDPSLEESLIFMNRENSNLTFEEQIFSMCADAGQPIDKFSHYTFYQFQKHFGRLGLNIDYKVFKPLEVSGQISFKNGGEISHWLKHNPPKGRYDDILIKKSTFTEQSDLFKVAQEN